MISPVIYKGVNMNIMEFEKMCELVEKTLKIIIDQKKRDWLYRMSGM